MFDKLIIGREEDYCPRRRRRRRRERVLRVALQAEMQVWVWPPILGNSEGHIARSALLVVKEARQERARGRGGDLASYPMGRVRMIICGCQPGGGKRGRGFGSRRGIALVSIRSGSGGTVLYFCRC